MQTNLTPSFLVSRVGLHADAILRKCVHCGFCNATCPTYQLLGDELDGPRGRIYQIKNILEGNTPSRETQKHLDQCLTCRNCETTCPSGVNYAELLTIGRELIEEKVSRSPLDRLKRWCIRETLAYPTRFAVLLKIGQFIRPLAPPELRKRIPKQHKHHILPDELSIEKPDVLLLQGCVQPALSPAINMATINVLQRLGIKVALENPAACCGALHHHTSGSAEALDFIRQRIDAWWPYIEDGIEAIISTTSGCGVHIKDYGALMADDAVYNEKARRISLITRDIAEFIAEHDLSALEISNRDRVAYHPPCTLQHGQKITGTVENILSRLGISLLSVKDNHLCCGSAGSYSLLNSGLATQLRDQKIDNLMADKPTLVVTGNIGCLHHLSSKSETPVKHWIELLA